MTRRVVQDQDWMQKPPWPWPEVDSIKKLKKKLEEEGIGIGTFKDSRVYRYHVQHRAWLKKL